MIWKRTSKIMLPKLGKERGRERGVQRNRTLKVTDIRHFDNVVMGFLLLIID